MTSVQIKNVPEETHQVLRQRAAESHQSLQEFLLRLLIQEAGRPTVAEVFARIDTFSGGNLTLEDAAELVRADRDSR
jgi:plasmid stability protein